MKIKIPLLPGFLFLLSASTLANAENKQTIEAETAEMSGGALKIADGLASKGYLASLNKSGQALTFSNLPASGKLAIRYASINVGTISVTINNQRVIKLNIHSSGAFTGSFL